MLHAQLPWFIGGPVLGRCVVALRWLMNVRLGAVGAWSDVVHTLGARRLSFGPPGWMLIGLVLGGAVMMIATGRAGFHGYGWLTDEFGTLTVGAILVVCGVPIGVGTKMAGGCTSGDGVSGNAMASPAALVATMTFFVTAIIVTVLTESLIYAIRRNA